jgi:hypothetical protein
MVITEVSKYQDHKVIRRKDTINEHLDVLFVTEQPLGELELDTAVYLVNRDDTHTFLCCISGQDITEFRDSLIATINNYRI